MPVMVTGAEHGLGAAVVEQLASSGGEVRTFLDALVAGERQADAMRARGCKVAVGELDDEGHLESALAQVHTVAHCHGGPLHHPDDQVTVAATLASALLGAGVRRLVWVRELAVDHTNPFLEAQDEIAGLFEALPVETVTLATALRHGPDDPFTAALASGWLAGGPVDLATLHAPIHVDDVARAVAAADRQRATVADLHMHLGLVGPETMPLLEVLHRLRRARLLGAPEVSGSPGPWVAGWLSQPAVAAPDDRPDMTVAHGIERLAAHATPA